MNFFTEYYKFLYCQISSCYNIFIHSIFAKQKKCVGTRSVCFNTWFLKSKLKPIEILLFSYYWWYSIPMRIIRKEFDLSDRTIVDWCSFCREVAVDQILENSLKIGGFGTIVEIDESKFGKSKSTFYLCFFYLYRVLFFRKVPSWQESRRPLGIWRG